MFLIILRHQNYILSKSSRRTYPRRNDAISSFALRNKISRAVLASNVFKVLFAELFTAGFPQASLAKIFRPCSLRPQILRLLQFNRVSWCCTPLRTLNEVFGQKQRVVIQYVRSNIPLPGVCVCALPYDWSSPSVVCP